MLLSLSDDYPPQFTPLPTAPMLRNTLLPAHQIPLVHWPSTLQNLPAHSYVSSPQLQNIGPEMELNDGSTPLLFFPTNIEMVVK